MATYRIQGPGGHVTTFRVPGPGLSERTFRDLVESGEWKIVEEVSASEETAKVLAAPPRKRAPRPRTARSKRTEA